MADAPRPNQDEELSFDQALRRLEELADRLEAGEVPLEEALQAYEEAVGLFTFCRQRLQRIEQRIEQLSEELDGTLVTEPLEPPADEATDG